MKNLKNIMALLLVLCMALSLCACAETGGNQETQGQTQGSTNETTEETNEVTIPDGMAVYTATVMDEGGNPIAGAMVQICKDDCFPGTTDANGVATFTRPEGEGYKISFLTVPAGYEYSGEETEFYYDGDAKEITITLKAVA